MCTYPLPRSRRVWVPPLRRLTFEQRKSKQNALAPPLGASPRLGMPAVRHCSVGPPRSAIHGRVAATPASCRGAHCAIPACGHRGLTGRLRSKARSTAKAKLPTCGSGLARDGVSKSPAKCQISNVIVNDHREQARSHKGYAHDSTIRSAVRPPRFACDFDLSAPLNHAGRHPILIWGVNRQDAGLAALGHGWPIAAAPQINVGLRAHRA
ncbi:hypothetical protein SAMN04490200_5550 [Pseudomonas proteolytica]|nr:hypothetical protein SAMN04490200_5550 [Pseudomonas proteolytica]